ncbi:hypothetical protein HB762_28030 (plasmid) [Vibrio campbellii]|uniref:Gp25 n=1 Tax=Vibrio campbellii TaxID=680 RepID=A0ABY5IQL8_9VIBR|nr:hypothetical protein [Vibrio campbellii]UTZ35024.1 hypothetical protein HB762_27555 [Vibrio campbellii]UTZ35114.1 hypothetical protein HB762_28030 [Vibrio campbellii]
MKQPEMTKNVRNQDKEFNERRRNQKAERQYARRTLSPAAIREAIRTGELPLYHSVLLGSKKGGDPFTIDDMRAFDKARKSTSKKWGRTRGAPLDQLIVASRKIDVQRANTEIQVARLYKVRGDLLHFNVTASGKHGEGSYQVRIRLENWMEELTQTQRSWAAAVKRICLGNVSIDCQCGRYQFWYRYVATAGNFAIAPYEKDFPKVRNPKLTGCCCKHQLKALGALKSPTVQAQLAKQLEAQAEKEGFAGDHTDSFLTKEDREQLERARPRDVDKAAAMQVINKMKQAKRVFKRQVKDPKYIKKLEKEVAELRKQLGKQQSKVSTSKTRAKKAVEQRQKQAQGANRDQLKAMLRSELDRAKMYGADRDSAVKVFAKMNKVPLADAQKLAKDL